MFSWSHITWDWRRKSGQFTRVVLTCPQRPPVSSTLAFFGNKGFLFGSHPLSSLDYFSTGSVSGRGVLISGPPWNYETCIISLFCYVLSLLVLVFLNLDSRISPSWCSSSLGASVNRMHTSSSRTVLSVFPHQTAKSWSAETGSLLFSQCLSHKLADSRCSTQLCGVKWMELWEDLKWFLIHQCWIVGVKSCSHQEMYEYVFFFKNCSPFCYLKPLDMNCDCEDILLGVLFWKVFDLQLQMPWPPVLSSPWIILANLSSKSKDQCEQGYLP